MGTPSIGRPKKAIGSFAELETNDNAASFTRVFSIKIITSSKVKSDLREGESPLFGGTPCVHKIKVAIRKSRMQGFVQTFFNFF